MAGQAGERDPGGARRHREVGDVECPTLAAGVADRRVAKAVSIQLSVVAFKCVQLHPPSRVLPGAYLVQSGRHLRPEHTKDSDDPVFAQERHAECRAEAANPLVLHRRELGILQHVNDVHDPPFARDPAGDAAAIGR